MPVTFFIDPELAEDEHLNEVKEITLSYTFFRSDEEQ
jgi:cytochrome c oxidase assembly protein subunit 11